MLTRRLALAFPIAACTIFVDGLAATRTHRNYLQATSPEDLADWEILLPSVSQDAPAQNVEISAQHFLSHPRCHCQTCSDQLWQDDQLYLVDIQGPGN